MGGLNLQFAGFEFTDDPITIALPRSKSISNRLLIMRALSKGAIDISFLSDADDTLLLEEALTSQSGELWLGHAGTALRFGLAWAAASTGERLLKGSARLHERPIAPLVEGLRNLGAHIDYTENEGFAPLKVRGSQLVSRPVDMEAGESSQFTSALMLIGPYVSGGLEILPSGRAVSAPYIDMTAQLMREAGAEVEISGGRITVSEGGYRAAHFDVECDWSAASYIYAFLALMRRGSIDLPGLTKSGLQGDERVAKIFSQFGVRTEFHSRGARLMATGFVETPGEINFIDCPDLAQTVAAVAAGLRQPLKLTGLQSLRQKETDRIAALESELAKCGVLCRAGDDYLELVDFKNLVGVPTIATYDDHRMAMAFAPLAVVFGEINIEDPEVVSKSFPGFWDVAGQVGLVGMVY